MSQTVVYIKYSMCDLICAVIDSSLAAFEPALRVKSIGLSMTKS